MNGVYTYSWPCQLSGNGLRCPFPVPRMGLGQQTWMPTVLEAGRLTRGASCRFLLGGEGEPTPGAARAWCGRPPLCPHVVPVWPVPALSSRELLPMSSYTDCHTALEPTQPDDLLLTSHVYSDPLQIRSCSEALGFRTSEGSIQPITNTVFEASQT